jgi:hypothetical protein
MAPYIAQKKPSPSPMRAPPTRKKEIHIHDRRIMADGTCCTSCEKIPASSRLDSQPPGVPEPCLLEDGPLHCS